MANSATFGKRQLQRPQPPATAARTAPRDAPAGWQRWPIISAALVVALSAIYLLQAHFDGGYALDAHALTSDGGVDWALVVGQGEWWRMLTAPLLHANPAHLIGNMVVLALVGALLERLIGSAWLAACFTAGAVGGSFGSLSYGHLVSVGASGAIMTLVATLFMMSYHDGAQHHGTRLRRFALFLLVPALLPSAAHGGIMVDIGAHLGGALAGVIMGFVILIAWPEAEAQPPFAFGATVFAATGLLLAVLAFGEVALHYSAYAAMQAKLAPASKMPKTLAGVEAQSGDLVERYPHDPAVRLVRALHFMRRGDPADAEAQLRAGLAERSLLEREFPSTTRQQLQALLAVSLAAQHRTEAAEAAAKGVCTQPIADPSLQRAQRWLVQYGVCAAAPRSSFSADRNRAAAAPAHR